MFIYILQIIGCVHIINAQDVAIFTLQYMIIISHNLIFALQHVLSDDCREFHGLRLSSAGAAILRAHRRKAAGTLLHLYDIYSFYSVPCYRFFAKVT